MTINDERSATLKQWFVSSLLARRATRLVIAIGVCCFWSVFSIENCAEAVEEEVERKVARSDFDIDEFRDFINDDLSRPKPGGSLKLFGRETRKIYGTIVDHNGKPIADAQVMIAVPTGYSGDCYHENFDKTDALGRFVVEGHIRRNRLAIRRASGITFGVKLDVDQETIKIAWPKPATLSLTVDPKFCEPNETIRIHSRRYWVGMSALQKTVQLNAERKATVEDLMPGDFVVLAKKEITFGDEDKYRYVEIGRFSIKAGEEKTLTCDAQRRVAVSGKFKPKTYVYIERQKLDYHHVAPCVDIVVTDDDGAYEVGPLDTGQYVMRFYSAGVEAAPLGRGFGGFGGGGDQCVWTKRIVVSDDDMEVIVDAQRKPESTTEFIHATLDSTNPMQSWSHADVQASQLAAHADRDGVVKELVRILNDPNSPQNWDHVIHKAMLGMTESPAAIDGLISALDDDANAWSRPSIITTLQQSKHEPQKIADAITPYRKSENHILRSSTFTAIGWLATLHPQTQEELIPMLVEALDDADDETRRQAAATLGRLGSVSAKAALAKLRETRKDPSGKVAVWSAWAIWKINGDGDREQAIEVLTEKLHGDKFNGKQNAITLLGDFENLSDDTIAALVKLTKFKAKPPYNGERAAKTGFKQCAVGTLKKVAPEALPSK